MIVKVRAIEDIEIAPVYINGKLRSSGITILKGTIGETDLEWKFNEDSKEIIFYINDTEVIVNIPVQVTREKVEIYMED